MTTCIFCGGKAGNREHIIAQWLIETMGVKKSVITVASLDGKGNRTERSSHKLNNYVSKAVCSTCNNGWMSELESWCMANAGPLVEPAWPILANDYIRLIVPHSIKLAAWSLKTAVMMDSNSLIKSIWDDEMIQALKLGYVVNDVYLDLAYIDAPNVSHIMSRGFRLANGSKQAKWHSRRDNRAYNCVIQLNHLALRVFRCPEVELYYKGNNTYRWPYRLYPMTSEMPENIDYRFHTLREFEESLMLRSSIRKNEWLTVEEEGI